MLKVVVMLKVVRMKNSFDDEGGCDDECCDDERKLQC